MKKLIYGIALNDADYTVQPYINGKKHKCKFYSSWFSMISRCYSKKVLLDRPSYVDCTVCSDWLTFSNFKAWMEQQDWQGKELDKDILFSGNKVYSPDKCCFVDSATNVFVIDRSNDRGDLPLGVTKSSKSMSFIARCSNPFSLEREYLGSFNSENEAHQAWKKRKHELACQLAELQTDERVAAALRLRYAP